MPFRLCHRFNFETATLVTDMKMLLRTSNLKAMTAKFRKCKADIEKEMADIEYQLTQMPSGSVIWQ